MGEKISPYGNARGEGGNKDVSQTQGMAGKDICFTEAEEADLSWSNVVDSW